jgi:hypothetical protein
VLTCISYEIIKHICTCKAIIYIYVCVCVIFNIIQFRKKQLNAIGVLDTSSNILHLCQRDSPLVMVPSSSEGGIPLWAVPASLFCSATSVERHTLGSVWPDLGYAFGVANLASSQGDAPWQSLWVRAAPALHNVASVGSHT